MKSVVVEASTVAKAIESAWLKAEKPEEFFIRVLQEHTSGFFGFGGQKAKIVFFFKNTHKSDSLFPVVVKQKEYSSFFGNSNLKVPAQLNFVDTDLNKNVILNPTHKKKPHNNQNNQQKPKQNNNVFVHGKTTETQVGNKPVLQKIAHVDKALQGQAVKQVDTSKIQVSLQAPVITKESVMQKNIASQVDKKEDAVKDVTKVLKKIQTQKIVANLSRSANSSHGKSLAQPHEVSPSKSRVESESLAKTTTNISRPVHKTMPKQVTAKFESYEDFINSTTGIPAEKTVVAPQVVMVTPKVSSFVKAAMDKENVETVSKEELVVATPQAASVDSQVKANVSTTPRVPLKLKRRPLTTDNPGVSGITRSSDKKSSDSLSDITKSDDVTTDDKE